MREESRRSGSLACLLAEDHARLDDLLQRAGAIKHAASAQCRADLLRHIGLEEKALRPAAQRWRGGVPLPIAAKRGRDHGALAALLVPTPTPAIIAAMRTILTAHKALEEGPAGLYERCEPLAGAEAEEGSGHHCAFLYAKGSGAAQRQVSCPVLLGSVHAN